MRIGRALAAVSLAGLAIAGVAAPAHAELVPWTDPSAAGTLTLCNQQGHAITSGSVNDKPWVWKVVASQGPAAPFTGDKSWAQLFLYAPIKGTPAASWTGEAMAGSSLYVVPAHPAGMSTSVDIPLSVFLSDYRLLWDGYLQARLVLSKEGVGYAPNYPVITIRVVGKRWHVVGSVGTAACSAGTATSDEITALKLPSSGVLPSNRPVNPTASATASPGKIGNADDPQTGSPTATTSVPTSDSTVAAAAVASSEPTSTGGSWWWMVLGLLVAAGVAGGVVVWARRDATSGGGKHQSMGHG